MTKVVLEVYSSTFIISKYSPGQPLTFQFSTDWHRVASDFRRRPLTNSLISFIVCSKVRKYAISEFAQKRIETILCCMRIGTDEIAEDERTKIRRIP
ncbi:hypothetical protein CEXT_494561 [Caerostris extrusa]|uniref:Uncharacterized protein n=1 Tax=Caerostris extrusa TaxID=172846 RepID=A0AAV4WU78_CAEEX|nr:hypothetical protein CEXT_494561 [Caerostris extrusa]